MVQFWRAGHFNHSIFHVTKARASNSPVSWKHAILNIAQAIELLLKERLRLESKILVFDDIDKFRPENRDIKTVSFQASVERLRHIIGSDLNEIDLGRLALAQKLRNQILHYETHLKFPSTSDDFLNLLNFFVEFYNSQIRPRNKIELFELLDGHTFNDTQYWALEFSKRIILFNGLLMSLDQKEEIESENLKKYFLINGQKVPRIPYGQEYKIYGYPTNEFENEIYLRSPCHDCFTFKGFFHLDGCDMEVCPVCRKQLLGCDHGAIRVE